VKDPGLLLAALEGLEAQKQRVEQQIHQVRAMLGRRKGRGPAATKPAGKPAVKRQLSAAAKRRIAAAQKRRWAEYRKRKAAAAG
jgi:hypothetical protein